MTQTQRKMLATICHPVTARRLRIAARANTYTPDAAQLARWEAEDARVAEMLAARAVDPFGTLRRAAR